MDVRRLPTNVTSIREEAAGVKANIICNTSNESSYRDHPLPGGTEKNDLPNSGTKRGAPSIVAKKLAGLRGR
jgi:hypothetical protein